MSSTDGSGERAGPSRRWLLAGGAAAVVGGGAGVGAGFLQPTSTARATRAPAALTDALAAERELLALVAAAARREPALRSSAAILTRDHTAHLRALQTAVAAYDRTSAASASVSASVSSSVSASPSSARDQLRAAERAAAATAAARAGRLTGPAATLLASISACESTHADLLS